MSIESKPESALATQVAGNHYKSLAIQPVEYCQRNGLHYCEAAVVKYVTRHRAKNGAEDIRKAIHFLELLLELEYGSNLPTVEKVQAAYRQGADFASAITKPT